jgi:glycosyltransferase involved in cell wall biosynthesis
MKVLIANYEFPPVGGGGSKASFALARALARRGQQVTVLTSGHPGAPSVEVIHNIRVHRVWSWRKGVHDCGLRGAITFLISALPRLRSILRSEDIDVVHYFFGLPTGLLSIYSHGIAKVPYVVSLRGSDVPLYDCESRKLTLLHRLTRGASRRIWGSASEVFAVSKGLKQMAQKSFPEVTVDVIYNGVDCDARPRESYGADAREAPVRITCVSRLIPRKGLGDLIEAVASLDDLRLELVLIGAGPSEEALREFASQRGVSDRVRFVGYCDPQTVMAENERADLFVLPTHSEAFANVILEAMSTGLPVVATRVGGVAEAVLDGETGILVDAHQPEQLAAAIRKLAENPDLRAAFGRAGRERVHKHFTWERTTSRYIEAYRRALAGAGAASKTTSPSESAR